MVGDTDGAIVGNLDGELVSPGRVGLTVDGRLDGTPVEGVFVNGTAVGATEAAAVGLAVGSGDGRLELGQAVGRLVGEREGARVGRAEGLSVGSIVGGAVGLSEGSSVGELDGDKVGSQVGVLVDGTAVGDRDGELVGISVGNSVG
jgi:hypothetical protein